MPENLSNISPSSKVHLKLSSMPPLQEPLQPPSLTRSAALLHAPYSICSSAFCPLPRVTQSLPALDHPRNTTTHHGSLTISSLRGVCHGDQLRSKS